MKEMYVIYYREQDKSIWTRVLATKKPELRLDFLAWEPAVPGILIPPLREREAHVAALIAKGQGYEPAEAPPSLGKLIRDQQEAKKADPNAAMIARDGPAKAAPVAVTAPADAPKPSPAGLTWSADLGASSHQVDWRHGTAML